MTPSPLVSIVMPTLNQVHYLVAAVKSVFDQPSDNIELIVADGMSTDHSLTVLSKLQRQYGDKLKWFSQKDTGPAQAINRALMQSSGDIIGFLNSDDEYQPEAIPRAIEYFAKRPEHQLVYGYANYIDQSGKVLYKFPTQGPSTPIDEFASGSFLCTSTLFIRRAAMDQIGAFDETLSVAYDWDIHLRAFKRYPRQIGMLRVQQATSRLHPQCMSIRMPHLLAHDAMCISARHLGFASDTWVWTQIDHIIERYPFSSEELNLIKQIEAFLISVKTYLKPEQLKTILEKLKIDYRLGLSSLGLSVNVQNDGWITDQVMVKYKWTDTPAKAILMECNAQWPIAGKMKLRIITPTGQIDRTTVEVPGQFILRFEVPESQTPGFIGWIVEAQQHFVPKKHDKSSTDTRRLAFKVVSLKLETES